MAEELWYYASQGQQSGPIGREVLRSMIVTGQVRADDMVWSPGMAKWQPAQTVAELMTAATPAAQGSVPSYAQETHFYVEFAGFWRRAIASLIDAVIIVVLLAVLALCLSLVFGWKLDLRAWPQISWPVAFGVIALSWAYYAAMECSSHQGTLGKLAIGIFVTDEMGREVNFSQATGRFFGKAVSLAVGGIGLLMAGWTQRKQTLHDMMAGTLVVRKK